MKHFGILGYPLKHTMSPVLHKKLADSLGEAVSYKIREIAPADLEGSMENLLSLDGFNVTIPYKVQIKKYLDGLDASAQKHGAVNVVASIDGKHIGYNTDCIGFVRCMQGANIPISGKVCIVGLGGVGRMFATECAHHGCELTIAVRKKNIESEDQNDETAVLQKRLEAISGKSVCVVPVEELSGSFDLLINASPVGMFPNTDASPVRTELLRDVKTVFDCIYNPKETKLMKEAQRMGCKVCGGMPMLVWQAAAAQEIWLQRHFTQDQIKPILSEMEEIL